MESSSFHWRRSLKVDSSLSSLGVRVLFTRSSNPSLLLKVASKQCKGTWYLYYYLRHDDGLSSFHHKVLLAFSIAPLLFQVLGSLPYYSQQYSAIQKSFNCPVNPGSNNSKRRRIGEKKTHAIIVQENNTVKFITVDQ